MNRLPKAVFVIDPNLEKIAVDEARKLCIPVVATLDTNCDPDLIDYPVPANDDSIRSVALFVGNIADACLEGAACHEEVLAQKRARGEVKEASEEVNGKEENGHKVSKKKQPQIDFVPSIKALGIDLESDDLMGEGAV